MVTEMKVHVRRPLPLLAVVASIFILVLFGLYRLSTTVASYNRRWAASFQQQGSKSARASALRGEAPREPQLPPVRDLKPQLDNDDSGESDKAAPNLMARKADGDKYYYNSADKRPPNYAAPNPAEVDADNQKSPEKPPDNRVDVVDPLEAPKSKDEDNPERRAPDDEPGYKNSADKEEDKGEPGVVKDGGVIAPDEPEEPVPDKDDKEDLEPEDDLKKPDKEPDFQAAETIYGKLAGAPANQDIKDRDMKEEDEEEGDDDYAAEKVTDEIVPPLEEKEDDEEDTIPTPPSDDIADKDGLDNDAEEVDKNLDEKDNDADEEDEDTTQEPEDLALGRIRAQAREGEKPAGKEDAAEAKDADEEEVKEEEEEETTVATDKEDQEDLEKDDTDKYAVDDEKADNEDKGNVRQSQKGQAAITPEPADDDKQEDEEKSAGAKDDAANERKENLQGADQRNEPSRERVAAQPPGDDNDGGLVGGGDDGDADNLPPKPMGLQGNADAVRRPQPIQPVGLRPSEPTREGSEGVIVQEEENLDDKKVVKTSGDKESALAPSQNELPGVKTNMDGRHEASDELKNRQKVVDPLEKPDSYPIDDKSGTGSTARPRMTIREQILAKMKDKQSDGITQSEKEDARKPADAANKPVIVAQSPGRIGQDKVADFGKPSLDNQPDVDNKNKQNILPSSEPRVLSKSRLATNRSKSQLPSTQPGDEARQPDSNQGPAKPAIMPANNPIADLNPLVPANQPQNMAVAAKDAIDVPPKPLRPSGVRDADPSAVENRPANPLANQRVQAPGPNPPNAAVQAPAYGNVPYNPGANDHAKAAGNDVAVPKAPGNADAIRAQNEDSIVAGDQKKAESKGGLLRRIANAQRPDGSEGERDPKVVVDDAVLAQVQPARRDSLLARVEEAGGKAHDAVEVPQQPEALNPKLRIRRRRLA